MFLRANRRFKDGKVHQYWSIVENKRVAGGNVVQRHVLYLGEINDSQREAWRKTIEIFEDGRPHPRTVALFPQERIAPAPQESIVRIRLDGLELHRSRQWGACWLACELYEQLGLDRFWAGRLPPNRKGHSMGSGSAGALRLPADRSGQRVASASAMVRTERDGGFARQRLPAGGRPSHLRGA